MILLKKKTFLDRIANLYISGYTFDGAFEAEILGKFATGTSESNRRCDKLMR